MIYFYKFFFLIFDKARTVKKQLADVKEFRQKAECCLKTKQATN